MAQLRSDIQLNCAQFLGAIGQVNEAVEGVKSSFRSALVQLAFLREGFEAVEGAAEKVREAVSFGAEMKDLSLATGQPIKDLVILRQAFENAGMGAEGVQMPLARLQKAIAGVNEDGEATSGVFEKLGVSVRQLRSESAVEQIATLQQAFALIGDASERTGLAMELFGRRGAQMLALLMDSDALKTAAEQVGGLGDTIDKNADKFHQFEVAIEGVKLKVLQFTAALAGNLGDGGFLEKLSKMDFTEFGAKTGAALSEIASGIKSVISEAGRFLPLITAIGIAMAVNTVQAKLYAYATSNVGVAARLAFIGSMDLTRAFGALQASFTIAMVRASSMSISLESVGAAATSAAVGIGRMAMAAATALGPFALFTAAVTIYAQRCYAARQAAEEMNDAMDAAVQSGNDMATQDAKMLANVSSEQERAAAAKTLAEQLDQVRQKIQSIDRDNPSATDEVKAEIARQYQLQADLLAVLEKQLAKIPGLVLEHRAAENAAAEALDQKAQKVAQLRKEMEGLLDTYDKQHAAAQRGGDSPEIQRFEVLRTIGPAADEDSIEKRIGELRNKPKKSDDEILELDKLIEASKQLDEINKKRAEADATTKQAADRLAMLKAELAGNSRLIESLEYEQKIMERTKQLRAAGVFGPEVEARKEVNAEALVAAEAAQREHALKMAGIAAELAGDETHLAALQDAERLQQRIAELRKMGDPNADQDAAAEQAGERALKNKKRAEYEQNFALDSARLLAQARGDTKAMREIDHQKRVGELTKEMVGAGMDKGQAAKLAETRAGLEESLKSDGSPAASALRRIGGGGGVGAGDPAMKERVKQSALQTQMVKHLEELNKKIKADNNPQINTGVFAYP